jgi:hypothetical protein
MVTEAAGLRKWPNGTWPQRGWWIGARARNVPPTDHPEPFPVAHWRAVLVWIWAHLPVRLRDGLGKRFGDVTRSEAWGYAVWGAMGVVIAVPELWAVGKGDDFPWPTISTTVGHLEHRWHVVALVPVALIVMAGYSALTVKPASMTLQADLQAIGRTPQGRLTKQDVTIEQLASSGGAPPPVEASRPAWPIIPYFSVATIVVVVVSVAAAQSHNRFLVGYVLYSLIAIFWVIVPNAGAYWFKREVQFTTLVFTVACLGRRLRLVASLVAALLVILLLHLALYPWPS